VDILNECEIVCSMGIFKKEQRNEYTMTLCVLYEHTHTHKIRNLPMFYACGKLTAIAEIPVLPYCGETFNA
jgi:hypothetical protein